MTNKNWLLVGVLVALAAAYVYWFTDWFAPATVQIFHSSRSIRPRRHPDAVAMTSLIFGLNRQLKLTEIKVVPLAAFRTNQGILPLWHVLSDSNSVPLKSFSYGQNIRGLRPAIKGARPQPLDTNTVYRMFVTAGKIKGEHDFELGGQ